MDTDARDEIEEDYELLRDLAYLYNFFQDAGKQNPKDIPKWMSKILPSQKKDRRNYLWHIHSDGYRLRATNGHALIITGIPVAFPEMSEPGFYDGNGVKVQDNDWARYPDTDRIIPDLWRPDQFVQVDLKKVERKLVKTNPPLETLKIVEDDGVHQETWISLPLIKKLFGRQDRVKVIGGEGTNKPVLFEAPDIIKEQDSTAMVIIMPIINN